MAHDKAKAAEEAAAAKAAEEAAAAKAAEEAAAAKAAENDGLLEMTDGNDVIRCHPDQVAAWERHSWKLTDAV